MLRLADRIFEFCASLKLAIVLILSLAFFLAVGTIYESRYGAQAAKHMVYGSTAFLLLMALLAINVLAAALIRFPWKRKQTGFVITHLGIEILLGGCLWSYRSAVDGKVAMRTNDSITSIDLDNERLSVSFPGSTGTSTWTTPVNFWDQAGFPSVPELLTGLVRTLPAHPTWPENRVVTTEIGDGVQLDVMNWLPAAKYERKCTPAPGHPPAVEIRLAGTTPMGMPVDEHAWIHSDGSNGSVTQLFGGVIEASLWSARSDLETAEFLHPPDVKTIKPMGRLDLLIDGVAEPVDVDVADALSRQIAAGTSGYKVKVDEYFPQATVKDDMLVKSGDEPTDPIVRIHLTSPAGAVWEYLVSSKYPFLNTATAEGKNHQANEKAPVILYQTPAALASDRQQRGRLQLLQTTDGKLLARRVGLSGLEAFEVKVGEEQSGWVGMKLTVEQYVPAADLTDTYRALHVSANKMDSSMRAIQVALTVDGQRSETWVARGSGPVTVNTPRGSATISYGFDGYQLPVSLSLVSAEEQTDPGSETAAAYTSVVSVQDSGGSETDRITMNHPLTTNGYTFYQSGFDDNTPGGPVTILSVRRDPGWILKYTGCALIVFGIFLMFYMKAYFQKSQVPAAVAERRSPALAGA
jgi:hypothetical protein